MARWKPTVQTHSDLRAELREKFADRARRYGGVNTHTVPDGVTGGLGGYWQRWVDVLDAGEVLRLPAVQLRHIATVDRNRLYDVHPDGSVTEATNRPANEEPDDDELDGEE